MSRFDKQGVGKRISLDGIYLLKHLDFVEVLDNRTIILGFKYNQKENMIREEFKNGDIIVRLNINQQGENTKYRGKATTS